MRKLIRLHEVLAATGLSRSEIYRLEALGHFPTRVPLSERSTAWVQDEIEKFVETRIAERKKAIEKRKTIGSKLLSARSPERQSE